MKFDLRPYQKDSVGLLRTSIINGRKLTGDRWLPILGLPTGAGKTVTFSGLANTAQLKGAHVCVVAHRKELIKQAKKTMEAYGCNPLMIDYGMVQTYVRSPEKIPVMDVCIIDECHIGNFRTFIDLLPHSVQVIGVTATPISSNKKNPLNNVFNDVVYPVQISELINDGYLSKPSYKIWKIDESGLEKKSNGEFSEASQSSVFDIENLFEAYEMRVGKTIIFTASIGMTQNVFKELELKGNENLYMVHSKMSESERDSQIEAYLNDPNGCMINCGILTAGFDDPWIQTVIMYRATTSLIMWLQITGRGSRVVKGDDGTVLKDKFNIYDLGNNMKRLLAWEVDRDWKSLFELQGRKLKDSEAPMKKCVECEAVIYASMTKCPYCGAKQPIKKKDPVKATEIQVIDSYSQLPAHLNKLYDEMTIPELIERAQYGSPQTGKPYKVGWIVNQLRTREDFPKAIQEFAKIKGYRQGWVMRQL